MRNLLLLLLLLRLALTDGAIALICRSDVRSVGVGGSILLFVVR